MINLDNLQKIRDLDKSNLLGSVEQLALQCQQTTEDLKEIKVPKSYNNVDKIVVNGMGGSRLSARVAERLFAQDLKIPLIPIGSYNLPAFVDEKTLLILSSYSGNTEEILTSYYEAIGRKAKIMILAQGGKLAEIAKKNKLPGYYSFSPAYNPCNQPRMSIGYQILGIFLLLAGCGLLPIEKEEIKDLIKFLEKIKQFWDINVSGRQNLAKEVAQKCWQKIPILVGAEFLVGSLHVWRNQINENAKQISFCYEIPELNHHLLEAMAFPLNNPQNLFFVFALSDLYLPENQKRLKITQKILNKYKISYEEVKLKGVTKIQQAFEIIQFGSFVSFYLAILNKLDPSPIPWVDYFKRSLENINKAKEATLAG